MRHLSLLALGILIAAIAVWLALREGDDAAPPAPIARDPGAVADSAPGEQAATSEPTTPHDREPQDRDDVPAPPLEISLEPDAVPGTDGLRRPQSLRVGILAIREEFTLLGNRGVHARVRILGGDVGRGYWRQTNREIWLPPKVLENREQPEAGQVRDVVIAQRKHVRMVGLIGPVVATGWRDAVECAWPAGREFVGSFRNRVVRVRVVEVTPGPELMDRPTERIRVELLQVEYGEGEVGDELVLTAGAEPSTTQGLERGTMAPGQEWWLALGTPLLWTSILAKERATR